jgi:hypothetical protein
MSYCPACGWLPFTRERSFLMGVVIGIAIAEGKSHLGTYSAAMGNAQFCAMHEKELGELANLARGSMRPSPR